MSRLTRTRPWRAAVALAAGGALALAGAASAYAADPDAIDPTRTASLTVHRYLDDLSVDRPVSDGRELSAESLSGLRPLPGAPVQVRRVSDVDLTTEEGWEVAGRMSFSEAQRAAGSVIELTTGADGSVTFADLPLGLYVVTGGETAGSTEIYDQSSNASGALVTLPLSDPADSSSWLYDVHVYPKSFPAASTSMSVQDAGTVAVGDEVVWRISTTIPLNGFEVFTVRDEFDQRLQGGFPSVSIDGVPLAGGSYTFLGGSSSGSSADSPETTYTTTRLSLSLTSAGLDVVNQHPGGTLEIDLSTTVRAMGARGQISNAAEVYTTQDAIDSDSPSLYTQGNRNDPWYDATGPQAPMTKFGAVTIAATNGAGQRLSGATYQVYRTEADALARRAPVTIDGASSWGPGSTVTISGLRFSSWENGVELTDPDAWQTYWLVESTAPAGYEQVTGPVAFHVTGNDTAVDLTVEHDRSQGTFTLPFTGGGGTGPVMLGGCVLLVVAAVVAVRRARAVRPGRVTVGG